MISFDLIKKWIRDHMKPKYMEDFNIPDSDLIGDWTYSSDNTCYKFIETIIGHYKRRLLITAQIEDLPTGESKMVLLSAEEVALQ